MDEIDRSAEEQGPSPRAPFDLTNRPPLAEEDFDEVDRPAIMINTPRSEPVLKLDTDIKDDDNDIDDSEDNAFKLDNNVKLPANNSNTASITETCDGPLAGNTSIEDGPLTQLFKKPTPTIQNLSEKVDHEGIVSKHTSYYPKEPNPKTLEHTKVNSDFYYDMSKFPRGRLTLINVKFFRRSSGMAEYPRHGTDRDADALVSLFLDLGFIVDRFDNPSKNEIIDIFRKAANVDYTNMSCCACALLSHGEEGIIYGTDSHVKINELTKLFRTKSLAGKPKFFLFQACQGSEYMDPIDSVDGRGLQEEELSLTLPSEADFLYAYSTVPGFYSWRNSKNGSWFVESLVAVFRECAHKTDVLRMLTRVNASVAYRKSRTDDVMTDNKRQIASIVTQMRKEFFLFPPYGPLSQ